MLTLSEAFSAINQGKDLVCALSDFGFIGFQGQNVAKFLQGQVTCDVNALQSRQGILSACCDHKGRMLATFWLFRVVEQEYYLCLPNNMIESTITHLKKYAVFSKIELYNVSNQWHVLGLMGESLISQAQQSSGIFIPLPSQKTPRAIMISTANEIPALLTTAKQIDREAWEYSNILANFTHITPQTRESFTPQMIDLQKHGGVSFKKGCYVGQEVVARTEHLGKLKRHLQQIILNETQQPRPGDELVDASGEVLGVVTVSTPTPQSGFIALAVIQDRAQNETLTLRLASQ